MKTTLFLLSAVVLTLLQILTCQAAPRKLINTYDQRQDGKLNVHAKLENFLFVFAPSSSAGSADLASLLENNLVAQALELKNVASRVANRPENSEIDDESDGSINPVAENSNDKEITSKELASEKTKGLEKTLKLVAILQSDLPDGVGPSESSQSSLKNEKNVSTETKIEANEKSRKTARSVAKISGELTISKLPPREIEQQIPLENKVVDVNDRGNSVGPAERKPQELKLIGGGIENCGPDRFRDRFGVCQFRVEP